MWWNFFCKTWLKETNNLKQPTVAKISETAAANSKLKELGWRPLVHHYLEHVFFWWSVFIRINILTLLSPWNSRDTMRLWNQRYASSRRRVGEIFWYFSMQTRKTLYFMFFRSTGITLSEKKMLGPQKGEKLCCLITWPKIHLIVVA
jgi:hypothetical protein